MIICLKSIRTDLQNMKFIEQLLSEIQLKYRYTIIEWEIGNTHQPNMIWL